MKKPEGPLIAVLSKPRIRRLIKALGLQATMFDTSLFTLDWDGLEYRFYIRDDRLLLESVIVRMDVIIGPMDKYETEPWLAWTKMRHH